MRQSFISIILLNHPISFKSVFYYSICLWLCSFSTNAFSQVTIKLIHAEILSEELKNNIFVAGNMNDWNPSLQSYKLEKFGNDWMITFKPDKKITTIEFKFTRGSWETVEVLKNGNDQPNRIYTYTPGMIIEETIESFKDIASKSQIELHKNIIQFSIYSDELKRDKNIRVYLPCDYDATTNKEYPVIYMLDAQNLFDASTSFSGEWAADEMMDSVCQLNLNTSIIIGIDHAGNERLSEYAPYKIKKMDVVPQGKMFASFMVHTLKPKIDSMYHTKKERAFTGIIGSSVGGTQALYCMFEYNNIFGNAGIFSPSLWSSEQYFKLAESFEPSFQTNFYFLLGAKEGGDYEMMFDAQRLYNVLLKKENPEIEMRIIIESDGQHNEAFWRSELFDCYAWLFLNK